MEGKLDKFRVGNLPTVFYVPDFISDSEESHLLDKINEAPLSKWKSLKNRRLQNWGGIVHEKGLLPQNLPPWLTKITQRIFEESGLFPSAINHVLINEYLPNQGIMPHQDGPAYFPVVAIMSLGSPVIMDFSPHARLQTCTGAEPTDNQDKSCYGQSFDIDADRWMDNHHPFSVVLMPRSLLIFKDEAYSDYLHGIKDHEEHKLDKAINLVQALRQDEADQASPSIQCAVELSDDDLKVINRTRTRVSLTCRLVSKVHKNLFKF